MRNIENHASKEVNKILIGNKSDLPNRVRFSSDRVSCTVVVDYISVFFSPLFVCSCRLSQKKKEKTLQQDIIFTSSRPRQRITTTSKRHLRRLPKWLRLAFIDDERVASLSRRVTRKGLIDYDLFPVANRRVLFILSLYFLFVFIHEIIYP